MGVDQAGGDDVAVAAEDLVVGLRGDRADGFDEAVSEGDVPGMAGTSQDQAAHGPTISA